VAWLTRDNRGMSTPPIPETNTAPASFEDFWLAFVADHQSAQNRWAPVAGLAAGTLGLGVAIARRSPVPLVLGVAAFAAFAVGGHPVFEGNRAKNFGRPVWATRAFLRLCFHTVTGSIDAELARAAAAAR